jgi:GT2 family glycosyltransferase
MTEASLVSIVMPTWNRGPLIGEAVASIVAQTWPHWELIVVDDGSTDDTVARVQAIGEPRLRIVASPRIGLIPRLRNLGAAQATGEWLAFLDSDDRWLPEKLALQMAMLAESGARWCYADHGLMRADGSPIPLRAGYFRPHAGRIARELVAGETAAFIGTLVIRRSLFDAVGGCDECLPVRDDLDLAFRLAAAAEAAVVPQVLTLVREHPARTTRGFADPHEQSAAVYEKVIARESDPVLVATARARLARLRLAAARRRLAAREPGKALRQFGKAIAAGASPAVVAILLKRG